MEICNHCHQEKEIDKFPPTGKRCRACQSQYSNQHYIDNKAKYLERNKKQRSKIRQFLKELKESTPCADCGIIYPAYVMDFDHSGNKRFNVSQMAGYSLDMVVKEIAKCEIVCANCHRKRTYASVV